MKNGESRLFGPPLSSVELLQRLDDACCNLLRLLPCCPHTENPLQRRCEKHIEINVAHWPILLSRKPVSRLDDCEIYRDSEKSFCLGHGLTRSSEGNAAFSCWGVGEPAFCFCVADGGRELRAFQ